MLLDPLVINHGMTLTATGGVASNLRRTAIGKYASTDGAFSTDQPARLSISPRWKKEGNSSYSAKFEMDKNVAPVNGVQQQDDTLTVSIMVSGNNRSFSANDYVAALATLSHTFIVNFPRIITGES